MQGAPEPLDINRLQHLRQRSQELRTRVKRAQDMYIKARDSNDKSGMKRAKDEHQKLAAGMRNYEDMIRSTRGSLTFKEWRMIMDLLVLMENDDGL